MIIHTSRLELRPLKTTDTEAYFDLCQNNGFKLFQISNYHKASTEEIEKWITLLNEYHLRNGFGIIGVFRKRDSHLIGIGALKYLAEENKSPIEIMYRFSDSYWGKGYGFETAKAICEWAFQNVSLKILVATVDPKNTTSKKILNRLGFVFQEIVEIQGIEEELYVLASPG